MRVISILILVLMTLVSGGIVDSQDRDDSRAARELKRQVSAGNYDAILRAADTGDKTLIPYLRELSADNVARRNGNHPAFNAHVALAKLGDAEATKQIFADVDDKSPAIQDNAMRKLSLIGGKVAFRKFYELLDDTRPRENPDCLKVFEVRDENDPTDKRSPYCDVIYFTRSSTSMGFLLRMVPDPPVRTFYGNPEEIELWKEWIKKNGYLTD